MYRRFHDRFGTAGVVIGVIALIAALGGTALAAGSLTSKQKKEVTKIAKKYAGKPGAEGPQGPAGANGANGKDGAQGIQGEKGEKGDQGIQGNPGAAGKNVVTTNIPSGGAGLEGHCNEVGGTKFQVEGSATKEYVCNGSPWTAGGTLPSGKTETGTWVVYHGPTYAPLSFNIPLAEAPESIHYVKVNGEEFLGLVEEEEVKKPHYGTPVNCHGSAEAPTAPAGMVCVYAGTEASAIPGWFAYGVADGENRYTSGANFYYSVTSSGRAYGTWAVTAK